MQKNPGVWNSLRGMPVKCRLSALRDVIDRMKEFPRFKRRAAWAALFAGAIGLAAPLTCAGQEGSLASLIQAAAEANKNKTPPPAVPQPAPSQPKQSNLPPSAKPVAPAALVPVAPAPAGGVKEAEGQAVPPVAATLKPGYAEIYEKNVFDPKRQPWIEKVEAPPPPPIAPLTQADAEVLGVMAFGSYKKAILKLGPGFKFAPQPKAKAPPRPFVILAVGESLGPYTLVEIAEKKVVFDASGTQYSVTFTPKKLDRPPPSAVTPMSQFPVVLAAPTPTIVAGVEPLVSAAAPANPAAQGQAAVPPPDAGVAPAPAAGTGAAPAAAAPAAAQDQAAANPAPVVQGRTLLEAIEAARAAQAAGQLNVVANPFVKR